MRIVLVSTYDLGRQPLGLASPAAWLREAGMQVECVDASRDELRDEHIAAADLVAFHLPMHTATRLAGPLIDRVRQFKPAMPVAAYGLYAPLNALWLRDRGVTHVLGPDAERELVILATGEPRTSNVERGTSNLEPRTAIRIPDRATLPPLSRYAALQMPNGSRRVVGNTETTKGCKHLCRHCPIVPVYQGRFTAIPIDIVMEDIRRQVSAGAEHITFGDADFFNGPTHAHRVVERLAREWPTVTYDVTIKIEHLLKHAALLPVLRDTGCLFITSAVESVDDEVLAKLQKGHTRGDFVDAVALCRSTGVALAPTFVPFTPWTTIEGYVDLLDQIVALDLVEAVAPIQLAIRLLVTAESKLLELADIKTLVDPFDPHSLSWPWRHRDPRVDRLQVDVMRIVGSAAGRSRTELFAQIAAAAGLNNPWGQASGQGSGQARGQTPPYMTEAWYCCAEPGPEQVDLV
jgi:radical SAM superfamily enzyme YgiQ (UPF0313 family)